MNKTKIVATIGPASKEKETIKELIQNGMNVARINLSHSDYNFCEDIMNKINELNEELNTHVAILLDMKGPEIRVGEIEHGEAHLKKDDKIRIYKENVIGDFTKFSTTYPSLINEVKYNTILKIDDGRIELQVIDKEEDSLLCKVLNDGILKSGKSLNVPGVKLGLPFLSDKDKDDILFAHNHHVDFLAASHVKSSEDILQINDLLIEYEDDHMEILAKIEKEEAINELDEIIKASDGIIIARGDLGVEIPMERVPGVQKAIINKCHLMGKVSLVATELLSTMETALRPTRAEVSDIANAVMDGTDAVILSGETTIGNDPVGVVATMEKIISSSEEEINYFDLLDRAMRTEKQDTTGSIAYSVTECAMRLKCSAIVAPTISGYTARKMSRFRPSCPILAVSPSEDTVKSLALHFGVHAYLIDELNSLDRIMEQASKIAKRQLNLQTGEKIIITGGYPFKSVKHTNFMKIEEI